MYGQPKCRSLLVKLVLSSPPVLLYLLGTIKIKPYHLASKASPPTLRKLHVLDLEEEKLYKEKQKLYNAFQTKRSLGG